MRGLAHGELAGHPYVRVGPPDDGTPLVVVTGLNDPLLRVTDALWFAGLVGAFGRRLRRKGYPGPVYVTSRPVGLPRDHSTRDMADDLADAIEPVAPANLLGVSMGGFVCQHVAHDHPVLVDRLVMGLSAARLSPRGRTVVERWREWAERGDWGRIYRAGVDAIASGPLRRLLHLPTYPYERVVSEPPASVDFDVSARASLDHDATDWLPAIDAPSLVVGGTRDPFFSPGEYHATATGLDARWERLDRVGHDAVLNHADRFDRPIVEFLRS